MKRYLYSALALLWLFSGACSQPKPISDFPEQASQQRDAFYLDEVRPVLEKRCVTCHACYSSPCQLNLADHEGIRRGATKELLYNGTRLREITPTRLGIDAQTPLEWNELGFFPVANGGDESIVMKMVEQRQKNAGAVKVPSKDSNQCPATDDDLHDYFDRVPEGGMPYGLPALTVEESQTLSRWLSEGYPSLSAEGRRHLSALTAAEQVEVDRWEALLNAEDPKSRLVGRYLYEHLFSGVIEFSGTSKAYFKLVRSETKAPLPAVSVKARRPYDEAGTFYYRFKKVTATTTHKNLFVYPLSEKKWQRFQELFYKAPWSITAAELPSYGEDSSPNPFNTFRAIPEKSRYQFLIDDSLYFAGAFIKGTVCEGNIAVNVIDEKFFVFFVDPDSKLGNTDQAIVDKLSDDLKVPGVSGYLDAFYPSYKEGQINFIKKKKAALDKAFPQGLGIEDIWNGENENPQAILTIFRHGDNSYVVTGAVGEVPKTIWVIDYSIFERLYYLLAAGFDVFGNVAHQAATRLYMDNLRVESEDMFLSFLPAMAREDIRNYWYRGKLAEKKMEWFNPYSGVSADPRLTYKTKDFKREFLATILRDRLNPVVRGYAPLEACCGESSHLYEKDLKLLTLGQGGFARNFPEFSLISIERADGKGIEVYSLIHNRGHLNISFMLDESDRLDPDEDTLTIQKGVLGSFPNYIFAIREQDVSSFVKATLARRGDGGAADKQWLQTYGLSRSRGDFWARFDAIQSWFDSRLGNRGGVLDLSKYELE